MITSIYRGGLGNQMFQIAAGYYLAKSNNDTYGINPSLQVEIGQGSGLNHYKNSIFKNFNFTDYKSLNSYKESPLGYSPIPYTPDTLLDGYFQSEKYFPNCRDDLNKLFGFESNDTTPSHKCVIHIRAGDYLYSGNDVFNVVTKDYFSNAIEYVKKLNEEVIFSVITDTLEYVSHFIPDTIKYSLNQGSDLDDMYVLSQSDYAIISNSTFSWWGSYLGKNKLTLAPYKWFNSSPDFSDIFREDTVKIQF